MGETRLKISTRSSSATRKDDRYRADYKDLKMQLSSGHASVAGSSTAEEHHGGRWGGFIACNGISDLTVCRTPTARWPDKVAYHARF